MILMVLFGFGLTLLAQNQPKESLGLPGDNLNLFAVMKLFQQSETLEGFEKNLNAEDTHINNLDLNGDNMVDYIKVIDHINGDVHTIVLQVAIDSRENQDVAVFTVQRFASGKVYIQLVGDEALYGKGYIVEPNYTASELGQTPNPGYTGNVDNDEVIVRTTMAETGTWPVVRFIFLPNYVCWHSSWYYGYYPSYWHTWHPDYWDYYYGYHYNRYNDYNEYYHRSHITNYDHYNDFYYVGKRSFSPNVNHRIEEGHFKSTYSHPDQRKEGENLFVKTHPNQSPRRSESSSGSQPVTTRRSDNTVTNKSVPNTSTGTNGNVTRSAPATVTNKSENKPVTNPNATTTRRTTESVTPRSDNKPSTVQTAPTPQQKTGTVTNRSEAKPTPVQNTTAPVRRATESTTPRSETRPTPVQNTSTPTRRAPESVTSRPISQPAESRPATAQPASQVQRSSPAQARPATTQPAPQIQRSNPAPARPATTQPAPQIQRSNPAPARPTTTQPAPQVQRSNPAPARPAEKPKDVEPARRKD